MRSNSGINRVPIFKQSLDNPWTNESSTTSNTYSSFAFFHPNITNRLSRSLVWSRHGRDNMANGICFLYGWRFFQDTWSFTISGSHKLLHPFTILFFFSFSFEKKGFPTCSRSGWFPSFQWSPICGEFVVECYYEVARILWFELLTKYKRNNSSLQERFSPVIGATMRKTILRRHLISQAHFAADQIFFTLQSAQSHNSF